MFKNLFYIFLLTTLILTACKEETNMNNLGLIPLPSKIEIASGKTLIDNKWSINHNNAHIDLDDLKELLTQSLNNHNITLNKNSNKIISMITKFCEYIVYKIANISTSVSKVENKKILQYC